MRLPEILYVVIDALLFVSILVIGNRIDKLERKMEALHGKFKALVETTEFSLKQIGDRVNGLEKGTIPDYEAAKKAADAVNDFSKGITAILNFDPYAALHKDDPENE